MEMTAITESEQSFHKLQAEGVLGLAKEKVVQVQQSVCLSVSVVSVHFSVCLSVCLSVSVVCFCY